MKLVYFSKIWKLKNGEEYKKGFHAGWLTEDGKYALKFGLFSTEAEVKTALRKKYPDREVVYLEKPPKYRGWDRICLLSKEMINKLTMSSKN